MKLLKDPAMLVAETILQVRAELTRLRGHAARVGLVPTMGALHEGHWSLIERCRRECDAVVVSIFVNPLQFAPSEDLERYPRTQSADLDGCRQRGVTLVFSPTVAEMYGGGLLTRVHVKRLGDGLCGASRPGHFDGVCTVVYKLLNIIQPDVAYFGEKDYQQLVIVRRMVRDLSLPVEIVGCPIIRDADGLALSSRNAYLTADERKRAPVIHEALQAGSERVQAGTRVATDVIDSVARMLRQRVDTVEYVALVDAETLAALELIDRPARLCVAVRFGRTRLIDNVALDASAGNH